MEDAYMRPVGEVLSHLGVDDGIGLSENTVQERRRKYGPNGRSTCIIHTLHK